MYLASAQIGPFRSINSSQEINLDDEVTVLVGMNEAGKTVILKALEKSNDALDLAKFDPIEDYPRKDLATYLKSHKNSPACAARLTYRLTDEEIAELNEEFDTQLPNGFTFSISHHYDNSIRISLQADEQPALNAFLGSVTLSADARAALKDALKFRDIPEKLKQTSLTEEDKVFLSGIEARLKKTTWSSIIQYELWEHLKSKIPKFLYFGDYELLPTKTNLRELEQRVLAAKNDPSRLTSEHRAVLALLRMADIAIEDFSKPGGYEPLKAKIEGVSINLTDQIMEFWKQNEDLEVEVDIRSDDSDESPYNNGPNLYLRIKNRRHRGVSTQFRQRSRGFIWFFSFLVWFDSVQHQLAAGAEKQERELILLLDEPGLSLHALAQMDFLRYIDKLTEKHQVIYTTHSPFMVHSDRLFQVRMIEDREKIGTVISDNISGSDSRTIFPLQAALGWTIAQNLFISERNLIVEGPSELLYLKSVSAILEASGRVGLRDDITIVPAGGLDKVASFVALLGANGLKLAILHDYRGVPEQKLMDLVKQKMISSKAVLNASQFRDSNNIGSSGKATDIEDLFDEGCYIDYFNRSFSKQLSGLTITTSELPLGDRILVRLERYLEGKNLRIRPSGGFNHYAVASYFASAPPSSLDGDMLLRFEALFKTINDLF